MAFPATVSLLEPGLGTTSVTVTVYAPPGSRWLLAVTSGRPMSVRPAWVRCTVSDAFAPPCTAVTVTVPGVTTVTLSGSVPPPTTTEGTRATLSDGNTVRVPVLVGVPLAVQRVA